MIRFVVALLAFCTFIECVIADPYQNGRPIRVEFVSYLSGNPQLFDSASDFNKSVAGATDAPWIEAPATCRDYGSFYDTMYSVQEHRSVAVELRKLLVLVATVGKQLENYHYINSEWEEQIKSKCFGKLNFPYIVDNGVAFGFCIVVGSILAIALSITISNSNSFHQSNQSTRISKGTGTRANSRHNVRRLANEDSLFNGMHNNSQTKRDLSDLKMRLFRLQQLQLSGDSPALLEGYLSSYEKSLLQSIDYMRNVEQKVKTLIGTTGVYDDSDTEESIERVVRNVPLLNQLPFYDQIRLSTKYFHNEVSRCDTSPSPSNGTIVNTTCYEEVLRKFQHLNDVNSIIAENANILSRIQKPDFFQPRANKSILEGQLPTPMERPLNGQELEPETVSNSNANVPHRRRPRRRAPRQEFRNETNSQEAPLNSSQRVQPARRQKRRPPQQSATSSANSIHEQAAENKPSVHQDHGADFQSALSMGHTERTASLIASLQHGHECVICFEHFPKNEQSLKNAPWQCSLCFTLCHVNCMFQWQRLHGHFKCPHCQRTMTQLETSCFCGRARQPKQRRPASHLRHVPWTCDQLCNKERACEHRCALPCHPGPCPPCTAMQPAKLCPQCKTFQPARQCSGQLWQCEAICGRRLSCQRHFCAQPCHEGDCLPCQETRIVKCHCDAALEKLVPCSEAEKAFSCGRLCGKSVCEVHSCLLSCHAGSCEKPCRVPNDTCPCGKMKLSVTRLKCTEPWQKCDQICGQVLPCGHSCSVRCHEGPCICTKQVEKLCLCGQSKILVTCSDSMPRCQQRCSKLRDCGRHSCNQVCCDAVEHPCPLRCGKRLQCHSHDCPLNCHRGPCAPCREGVSFDDLQCMCGRSQLLAPVACGAQLPACNFVCPHPSCADHASVQHACHNSREPCPPCRVPVKRQCRCGLKQIIAQCGLQRAVLCGTVCRRIRLACQHVCQSVCHADETMCSLDSCSLPCGRLRSCGHGCKQLCGHSNDCDSVPCTEKSAIRTCTCERIKEVVPCPGVKMEPLQCTDVCLIAARNKQLAEALGIDKQSQQESFPYHLEFIQLVRQTWSRSQLLALEEQFTILVQHPTQQSIIFPPMRRPLRHLLKNWAKLGFDLDAMSVDHEPKRSVQVIRRRQSHVVVPLLSDVCGWNDARIKSLEESVQEQEVLRSQRMNSLLVNAENQDQVKYLLRQLPPTIIVEHLSSLELLLCPDETQVDVAATLGHWLQKLRTEMNVEACVCDKDEEGRRRVVRVIGETESEKMEEIESSKPTSKRVHLAPQNVLSLSNTFDLLHVQE